MKLAPVDWNSDSIIDLYNSYMSEVDHSSWYLEELMRLAYECDTITEIGMFQGHSISAFLRTRPKKLTGYEIDMSHIRRDVFHHLCPDNTELEFIRGDSLTMPVIDECDLLFIDTVHRYEHVIQELNRHGNQAQKFVVVHDTNYPPDHKNPTKKVGDAVREFVDNSNGLWYHYKELTERSGMMVIARSALSSAG